ncbi:MAG: endonuclease/exonuclease/phosphatase family protein [Bacteroidota bacterium]
MKLILFLILFLTAAHQSMHPSPFRLMTYNIRYNTPNDGPNWWEKRKEKVFTLIEAHAPDVLGVQEAVHSQMLDLDSFLINYDYYGVGRADGKTGGEYAAVFFNKNKLKLLDSGTFWLSEQPDEIASVGWDASMERICSWVKLEEIKSEKTFFVFNAHFDHIGKEARKNSAILIVDQINKITENEPVVLMGDLNFTPDEVPFSIILESGFKDVFGGIEKVRTFTGFEVKDAESKRIDYIFTNEKIKVKGCLIDDRNDGQYFPSDHLPVLADVVF